MRISGAKVLITHTQTQSIMRSTVVALELATYLKEMGASVEVYAGAVGHPGNDLFIERGIPVECDINHWYSLGDYDLIWVQSEVLPLSIIDQLVDLSDDDKVPAFVFNHMTALDFAADEHPYIYLLEERLAAKVLFVSAESFDKLTPFYRRVPVHTAIFPNPAPPAFGRLPERSHERLTKVLVVSNHVPPEVWEACRLLRERNIDVKVFGEQGEYSLVTPEVLADVDAVVTIGKTVQYCLTAGIPVYVYDHFGGFGYLNEGNLETAARNNYSGRGGSRFTAENIAESMVAGYASAKSFVGRNRDRFIDRYALDKVLPSVLSDVEPKRLTALERPYALSVRSAMRFAHRYYEVWASMNELVPDRNRLRAELDAERDVSADLSRRLAEDEVTVSRLSSRLHDIEESESFKIGKALMLVPHMVKDLAGRIRFHR